MIITPIFNHGDGIWEVTQKGTSKATGMEFLWTAFPSPKENCYAFGDSPNDLPMLKAAGVSVAREKFLRRHRKTLHTRQAQ